MGNRLPALTSIELVVAEGHYHESCYRLYTKCDKTNFYYKTDYFKTACCTDDYADEEGLTYARALDQAMLNVFSFDRKDSIHY